MFVGEQMPLFWQGKLAQASIGNGVVGGTEVSTSGVVCFALGTVGVGSEMRYLDMERMAFVVVVYNGVRCLTSNR